MIKHSSVVDTDLTIIINTSKDYELIINIFRVLIKTLLPLSIFHK